MRNLFRVAILFLLICSPVFGANVYIDGALPSNCTNSKYSIASRNCSGSDGNAYKDFSTFCSWSSTSYGAGDAIYVRGAGGGFNGTYDHSGDIDAVIIYKNNVTLTAYGTETPIISSSPSGRSSIFVAPPAGGSLRGITISRLRVTGARCNLCNGPEGAGQGIIVENNTSNTTISYNTVYNNDRTGIHVIGDAGFPYPTNIIVEYNTAYGNGTRGDGEAGIALQRLGNGCIIRFNTVYNNQQPTPANPSSWIRDGTANRWYSTFTTVTNGTDVFKVYGDVSGQNGEYYTTRVSSKNLVDGGRKHYIENLGGTSRRIYVYHEHDPTTTFWICSHPSGYKYPDGNGITIDSDSGAVQVYGNVAYGNGGAGINSCNSGNDGIKIYNNTVYNNGTQACSWDTASTGSISHYSNRVGINTYPRNANMEVKNNIMFNNFQYNLAASSFGNTYTLRGVEIDYNLYYNAGSADIRISDGSTGAEYNYTVSGFNTKYPFFETHGVSSDPLVVNATGGDFHLNSSSPAIDAGVDLSGVFTVDRGGTPIPQGPGWDIGGYEYSGKALSPPKGLQIIGQ